MPLFRVTPQSALVILGLLLSLAALLGVDHRSRKGKSAMLRWERDAIALEAGDEIYQTGPEGYPTLPLSILLLKPFYAMGERLGPLAWALFKICLAWWILVRAFEMARYSGSSFPPWASLAVLLLSCRVLYSDIQHGNLNIIVGAVLMAGFCDWQRGRELRAGIWFGLGGVLKVTPLLALFFLLRKQSYKGLFGAVLGILLFALFVPGIWLGMGRNLGLAQDWWSQMVAPYLIGRDLTIMQTEQINQSLLGVGARLLTDCVAVCARPPVHLSDIQINLMSMSSPAFKSVHAVACCMVILFLGWRVRPEKDLSGQVVLGEAALFAMSMLLLSERSWKHHYVLLALPLTYLAWTLAKHGLGVARGRTALLAMSLTGLFIGLSGDAVLGDRGADLAEAYGAWLWAAVVLLGTVGMLLPSRAKSRT